MLPYDYPRCISEECPNKYKCLRYTDWPKYDLVPFGDLRNIGDDEGNCVFFIQEGQNALD